MKRITLVLLAVPLMGGECTVSSGGRYAGAVDACSPGIMSDFEENEDGTVSFRCEGVDMDDELGGGDETVRVVEAEPAAAQGRSYGRPIEHGPDVPPLLIDCGGEPLP